MKSFKELRNQLNEFDISKGRKSSNVLFPPTINPPEHIKKVINTYDIGKNGRVGMDHQEFKDKTREYNKEILPKVTSDTLQKPPGLSGLGSAMASSLKDFPNRTGKTISDILQFSGLVKPKEVIKAKTPTPKQQEILDKEKNKFSNLVKTIKPNVPIKSDPHPLNLDKINGKKIPDKIIPFKSKLNKDE